MPLTSATPTAESIALLLAKSGDVTLQQHLNSENLIEWCKRVYATELGTRGHTTQIPSLRTQEANSPSSSRDTSKHQSPPSASLFSKESPLVNAEGDAMMEDSGRHGVGELSYRPAPGEVVVMFPSGSSAPQYPSSAPQRLVPNSSQMQVQQVFLPLLSSCQDKGDTHHDDPVCVIKYPAPSPQLHTVRMSERGTYKLSVDDTGCGWYESVEEAVAASVKFRGCSSFPPQFDTSSEIDLAGIHYSLKHDMYRLVWEGANLGLYESPREALASKMRVVGRRATEPATASAGMNTARHTAYDSKRLDERESDLVERAQDISAKGSGPADMQYGECHTGEQDESVHEVPAGVDLNAWPKQLLHAAAVATSQRNGLCASSAEALKVLSNAAQALVILGQAQAAGPTPLADNRPSQQQAAGALSSQAAAFKDEQPARNPSQYVASSALEGSGVPHLTIRLQPQNGQEAPKLSVVKPPGLQLGRSSGAEWNLEGSQHQLDARQQIRWPVAGMGDERSNRIQDPFNLSGQELSQKHGMSVSSLAAKPAAFTGSPSTTTEAQFLRCKVKAVKNNKFELYVENRYFGIFPSREAAESMAQHVHSMSWQDVWAFKEQRAASREARRHKKIEALAALASGAAGRRDHDESEVDEPYQSIPAGYDRTEQSKQDDRGAKFLNLNVEHGGWQSAQGQILGTHASAGMQPSEDKRRSESIGLGTSALGLSQVLALSNDNPPTPMDTEATFTRTTKDTPRRLPCCMRLNRKLLKFELLVNGTYFGLFDTREEAETARQAIRNMTWDEVCEFRKRFVRGKCRSKPAGQILVKPLQGPVELSPPAAKASPQNTPPATPARSTDQQPEEVSDSPMPEAAQPDDGAGDCP